jgi:hypothetical protein
MIPYQFGRLEEDGHARPGLHIEEQETDKRSRKGQNQQKPGKADRFGNARELDTGDQPISITIDVAGYRPEVYQAQSNDDLRQPI